MERIAEDLAHQLLERCKSLPPERRLLVGIAGIPASGKTSLAEMVVDKVNRATAVNAPIPSNPVDMCAAPSPAIPDASPLAPSSHNPTHSLGTRFTGSSQPSLTSIKSESQPAAAADPSSPTSRIAILVGLDGWHLTRAQLRAMPDPQLAFDRRGVHWTFDPDSYLGFVKELREPVPLPKDTARAQDVEGGQNEENATKAKVITAPSFDHAVKDPTPHAIRIFPGHRIVVIEGLYVLLSSHGWKDAADLLDERWLVDVGVEEAKNRLVKRHVITGVAKNMEEASWRADNNDMPNGIFLLENMVPPTKRIQSVEDPVFSSRSRVLE